MYQSDKLPTSKPSDDDRFSYCALDRDIQLIKIKVKVCDDLPLDELKIKGWKYLITQVEYLQQQNERLLGYESHPKFTDEQISERVSDYFNEYLESAVESGLIHPAFDPITEERIVDLYYSEDYDGFVNGSYFEDDPYFEELAYNDLSNDYEQDHPKGHEIDEALMQIKVGCMNNLGRQKIKSDFINEITSWKQDNDKPLGISQFITPEYYPCVLEKIRTIAGSRPNDFKGKNVAILIKAMDEVGYINIGQRGLKKFVAAMESELKLSIPYDGVAAYYNGRNDRRIYEDEIDKMKRRL